jgi:hypothetical protein
LTGNANAAALCEISFGEGTCIESTISDPIQITGDLDGFCNSYVNDCQESNLIDLEDGSNGITDIQLQVYEKPDDHGHPEYYPGCNIKILWGNGNNHLVDFWVDIGDNVETCKHNIPIYYYHTTAEMCGSAPCYGQFP